MKMNSKINFNLPILLVVLFMATPIILAEDTSLLIVEGQGEVQVAPDMAYVNLGVNRRADEAKQAQSLVNEAFNSILNKLEELGIPEKDIQTSRLNLNPIYDNSNRRGGEYPRITGYNASYSISIRVYDLSKLGNIIDSALDGGSNQLQGVRFDLQDESEAQAEALKKAVRSARIKAEALSEAAGVNLLSIQQIQESGSVSPMPRGPQVRAMYAEAAAPTQVMPGMMTVSASVSITWRIDD